MKEPSQIVDAHVHVWSANTDRYPLAPGFKKSDLWQPFFTPETYFQYSQSVGKVRLNLVQMTWYGLDHNYILDLIADDPETFVGTGIVPAITDVSLPSPEKTMVALAQSGIYAFRIRGGKTARQPIGNPARWLDYPGYEQMFQTGAQHNLALSFLMGTDDLPELDRMCTQFPETPVILDHVCGIRSQNGILPESELELLYCMAKHNRVMVKLGPFQALGNGRPPYLDLLPLIRGVVDAFGSERCMWESDSGGPIVMKDPTKDYPLSIALVQDQANFLSNSDKKQILSKTAEDFFFNR